MKKDELGALGASILSDLSDAIPQIPPISFIGDALDAITLQVNRTVFKDKPVVTIPSLAEFAPLGDLLPGHTLGALTGISQRYGSLKAAGLAPPPPPKITLPSLPAIKVPELPKFKVKA